MTINEYEVFKINSGIFSENKKVTARTPKQAAEIATGKPCDRVIESGCVANVVVYGTYTDRNGTDKVRSYVFITK